MGQVTDVQLVGDSPVDQGMLPNLVVVRAHVGRRVETASETNDERHLRIRISWFFSGDLGYKFTQLLAKGRIFILSKESQCEFGSF